ncbi:MAG TPA: hypothetical protein VE991_02635 [Acidimicrobiales bacterium]|nr:hypothetical protein [Acidimicrobiales bacterium]
MHSEPHPPSPGVPVVLCPEVEVLLDRVPEFAPRYLELVAAFDDDPGAAAAFTELADMVALWAEDPSGAGAVLHRAMAAVEEVASTSVDAEEVVGWCFLDSLDDEDLDALEPWMGAATRRLRHRLAVDDG